MRTSTNYHEYGVLELMGEVKFREVFALKDGDCLEVEVFDPLSSDDVRRSPLRTRQPRDARALQEQHGATPCLYPRWDYIDPLGATPEANGSFASRELCVSGWNPRRQLGPIQAEGRAPAGAELRRAGRRGACALARSDTQQMD